MSLGYSLWLSLCLCLSWCLCYLLSSFFSLCLWICLCIKKLSFLWQSCVCVCVRSKDKVARPFEKIEDITDCKELWKIFVRVHHKWFVLTNNKEHVELVFIDANVSFKVLLKVLKCCCKSSADIVFVLLISCKVFQLVYCLLMLTITVLYSFIQFYLCNINCVEGYVRYSFVHKGDMHCYKFSSSTKWPDVQNYQIYVSDQIYSWHHHVKCKQTWNPREKDKFQTFSWYHIWKMEERFINRLYIINNSIVSHIYIYIFWNCIYCI